MFIDKEMTKQKDKNVKNKKNIQKFLIYKYMYIIYSAFQISTFVYRIFPIFSSYFYT